MRLPNRAKEHVEGGGGGVRAFLAVAIDIWTTGTGGSCAVEL